LNSGSAPVVKALVLVTMLTLVVSRRVLNHVRFLAQEKAMRMTPMRWVEVFQTTAFTLLGHVLKAAGIDADSFTLMMYYMTEGIDPHVNRSRMCSPYTLINSLHRHKLQWMVDTARFEHLEWEQDLSAREDVFLSQILSYVITHTVSFISALGYWGVGIVMAIESANIPLPSEVILPFGSYLVSTGRLTFWGTVLAGVLGGTIGSALSYALGLWRRPATQSSFLSGVQISPSIRFDGWPDVGKGHVRLNEGFQVYPAMVKLVRHS
jgi:hypothetical protein